MIVVDTNIIGYLFLSSEHSHLAENTLQKDNGWAAPILWRSELRNVLTSYMRKDLLKLNQAQRIMEEAQGILNGREYMVSSDEVLRFASESQCTAYDCEFIALAHDLNTLLITVDKKLLQSFPTVAVPLTSFGQTEE